MAVLELSEEARAVRDAAKNCAAGNISLADYRMIRRVTLATMLGIDPDEEETVDASDAEDATEIIDHIPTSQTAGKSNTMIIVAAGALVLVAGVVALVVLA